MNELTIASITVATNARESLPAELRALLKQTRPIDEIIVVDNASTDGTAEMVRKEFPSVTLLPLNENLGVAGAAAHGLKHALANGHDWMWWLDDDSVPADDAIAQLFVADEVLKAEGKKIGILASVAVDPKTNYTYPGMVWRNRLVQAPAELLKQKYYCADSVMSSGSFISRELLENIGLPRSEYFMDFVDHDFNLRARRAGFEVVVVQPSVLYHSLGEPRMIKFLGFGRMYSSQPAWRHYYMSRNETDFVWREVKGPKARTFLILRLLKRSFGVILLDKPKFSKLRMIAVGFADGLANRLGIRVRPNGARG